MTRKEIEKLPFNIDMLLSESLLVDTKEQVHKKITEVCSLAIKALEQEPCEDAISRQAVFEQINCWIGSGEYKYTNATYYLTRRMQELPPVTPKPKMEAFDKIRAEIATLQNRCYSLTKGTMCVFCKFECEYKAESEG